MSGDWGQQLSGTVRVAASQTISAHLIPQCIAEGNQRYPDIDFVLHDRPQQWVLESIRQGDVDFGIVIDPGQVSDLECEIVLSEPFLLLCRTTIRWQCCLMLAGRRCRARNWFYRIMHRQPSVD
ncbi:LysR family transcriptional regulator [Enterobacter cloacae]|uniref:LysR family transcriptional regulator n=1 Tax=Enterobacter cloacae TaxID=550 RepID=A0A377LXJ8_ENTCL|nr:LysR family transcriptional regulator [Enterobacter cloacae]